MREPWVLDDALKLVRSIQDKTREFGYHVAMGGGVLNTGKSEKDLDLIFLPLENLKIAKKNPDGLLDWLEGLWGRSKAIYGYNPEDEIADAPRPLGARIEPIYVFDEADAVQRLRPRPILPFNEDPGLDEEVRVARERLRELNEEIERIQPYQVPAVGDLEEARNRFWANPQALGNDYWGNDNDVQRQGVRIAPAVQRPAAVPGDGDYFNFQQVGREELATSAPESPSIYIYKVKFTRASGDRIDAFIC